MSGNLMRFPMRSVAAVLVCRDLIINDVDIHTKNGQNWAQLSARPRVKDGQAVTDDEGRPKYFPVLEFDSTAVRDAFSAAVIKALLEHDPRALECRGAP